MSQGVGKVGIDVLGARGSNAGDEFHELWATRAAIRLLDRREDLRGLTVEGVAAVDAPTKDPRVWDGVDCTLYFGGLSAETARHIRIEQLKYSSGAPNLAWTVGRLTSGEDRGGTVLNKLARSWAKLKAGQKSGATLDAALVTNQPISKTLAAALKKLQAAPPPKVSKVKPDAKADDVLRLAWAIGLPPRKATAFVKSLRLDGGAGSRFAVEEKALAEIAKWTDQDVMSRLSAVRRFVRERMMPQPPGEVLTEESVILRLGAGEFGALFPCQPELALIENPIARAEVTDALEQMCSGAAARVCFHGEAGVGKTTALTQVRQGLPAGSEMVIYDCYGAGRYLDSDALRHRAQDAFLQLTNEVAVRLDLPLLVTRPGMTDPPRVFANRLRHAARALAAQVPDALLVIAVDAADNSITAAKVHKSKSFVHDFLALGDLPANVRLVVTSRSGRLIALDLPRTWTTVPIEPFDCDQTAAFVSRRFSVPRSWVVDFHGLARGVPRVEDYALQADDAAGAMERLLPGGKSLDEVFKILFEAALKKNGVSADISRVCAGLVALPRPTPLQDLAAVVDLEASDLIDICGDLAPGIKFRDGSIGFADEDFEEFVREEGQTELAGIRSMVADRLLAKASTDRYAALHVASALRAAGRHAELLELVEREPAPLAVTDPVTRREGELNRLRNAIQVCRAGGDLTRALRFVLLGAESVRSERALKTMLKANPDLAVRFAGGTVGRLLLSDVSKVSDQGAILYQRFAYDAERRDTVSMREGRRLLTAWWQVQKSPDARRHSLTDDDVIAHIDAVSRIGGAKSAVEALKTWTPRRIALMVSAKLPWKLAVEGRDDELEALAAEPCIPPRQRAMLRAPLVLKGQKIGRGATADLAALLRKTDLESFFAGAPTGTTRAGLALDVVLTACELLASNPAQRPFLDQALAKILTPTFRRIDERFAWEAEKLDVLFRAWALSECLAGREPVLKEVFVPRPAPETPLTEEETRRQASHDRDLLDMTQAVAALYVTRSQALVVVMDEETLQGELDKGVQALGEAEWRLGREHGAPLLRALAARGLLTLAGAGYSAAVVGGLAIAVHGPLASLTYLPNLEFVQRMSLWPELHDRITLDLSAATKLRREARIGADDRASALMTYARLLLPIAPDDANVVFNDAIAVASELDSEAIQQIELIQRLIVRAGSAIPGKTDLAAEFAEIISDAAIRLQDHDSFPWKAASAGLAVLDPVQALAAAARWDDAGLDTGRDGLAPALVAGLASGALRPEQAAALSLFLDREEPEVSAALEGHGAAAREELAWDRLVRWGGRATTSQAQPDGSWTDAFIRHRRFIETLDGEPASSETSASRASATARSATPAWRSADLVDPVALGEEVMKRLDAAHAAQIYIGAGEILSTATAAVGPKDRVAYLHALSRLTGRRLSLEVGDALLGAVQAWRDLPAVSVWRRQDLRAVITARLPEFTRSLSYGGRLLDDLLNLCDLGDDAVAEVLLRGIETHVGVLDAEVVFNLADRIVVRASQGAAADLAAWYISLLGVRIPVGLREGVDRAGLPKTMDEAVARYLFAYMGDMDVRLRWRAAHGVRRLARLADSPTLAALIGCAFRETEPAFRTGDAPFYWLSARQWWALSWARVASERPSAAVPAAPVLFEIATSTTLPHLLIKVWASDACRHLAEAGVIQWNSGQAAALAAVGRSPLPRQPGIKRHGMGRYDTKAARASLRFDFDPMDTLPYWYDPILRCFATLEPAPFLEEAERWILDVWTYPADRVEQAAIDSRRRGRSDWALSSNSHGAQPTIEDLRTYLEWNALWTAAGRLLSTEPLRELEDEYDESWENLIPRTRREMLSSPPGWLTDFRTAIPLQRRYWRRDDAPLEEWAEGVVEALHRAEIFPDDRPGYLVVRGHVSIAMQDRTEQVSISSALAGPQASAALVRALQTMEDSWDYKIPDENEEDWSVDQPPLQLMGWLRHISRDGGSDDKDPFRGQSTTISSVPGQGVSAACGLTQDRSGLSSWSAEDGVAPMFLHEAWGDGDKDSDWIGEGVRCQADRLLVHREQLKAFLSAQEKDLVIEVEIRRNDREAGRYTGKKTQREIEGRYDRLYRLDRHGSLHVAEGDLGPWPGA